jgi:type VI protein secretion system component VasK
MTKKSPKAKAKAKTLIQELVEALEAVKADRQYQRLSGGAYFTSAQTEDEWKRESARKAWAKVDVALRAAQPKGGGE